MARERMKRTGKGCVLGWHKLQKPPRGMDVHICLWGFGTLQHEFAPPVRHVHHAPLDPVARVRREGRLVPLLVRRRTRLVLDHGAVAAVVLLFPESVVVVVRNRLTPTAVVGGVRFGEDLQCRRKGHFRAFAMAVH